MISCRVLVFGSVMTKFKKTGRKYKVMITSSMISEVWYVYSKNLEKLQRTEKEKTKTTPSRVRVVVQRDRALRGWQTTTKRSIVTSTVKQTDAVCAIRPTEKAETTFFIFCHFSIKHGGLDCRDLLCQTVQIESLNQDHVKTFYLSVVIVEEDFCCIFMLLSNII